MTRTLKVLIGVAIILILSFAVAGNTRAAEEPQIVRVSLKDYQVDVSQFVVESGRSVKFVVANEGMLPHQFVVRPIVGTNTNGTNEPVVGVGTSRTIEQVFAPGIYRVSCELMDHTERGMVSAIAATKTSRTSFPISVTLSVSLLTFIIGCVYIIGDSLGLRLVRTSDGEK